MKPKTYLIGLIFFFITLLHIWSLMRYPPPFVDEAWSAARAWSYIQTGHAFGTLDAGVFDRFEGYWTFFPQLPVWFQSAGLLFVDTPNLLIVRIVSLFFGFLLLFAIYLIGVNLYDWKMGLVAVILVSLSKSFIYSAHLARPDIFASALGFLAIALYFANKKSLKRISFLSGLLIGLAFEIHPHSIIIGLALVSLFLLDLRKTIFKNPLFWSFVAGGFIGLVFYITAHILPYPETYFKLNELIFSSTHIPPFLSFDPNVLLRAIRDIVISLISAYSVLIILPILALIALIKRRSQSDQRLVCLTTTLLIGAALLFSTKFDYYYIYFTPAIDLVIATFLLQVAQLPWTGKIRDYFIRVLVWGSLAAAIAQITWPLLTNSQIEFTKTQTRIQKSVQTTDIIMGAQHYWFDFYNQPYYSWEQLVYFKRYSKESNLEDAFREFKPDIFIIDNQVNQYISDISKQSIYSQHLIIPKTELEILLNHHATLMDEFNSDIYGLVQIYRINWDE